MAQYTQRTQPMHRPGQTDHGHGGGTLAYGGKPGGVVPPQPRPPPAAPYAPQPYPPMRLHQPGYGSAALSYRDSSYGRSGGAVGEYRAGSRMSILGTGYLPPSAPAVHHPPPADPPPFKKIRLTAERPQNTNIQHQPLRIDTREPVSNYNTVEVLSPNPPSEPTLEEQNYRTTKDDLLQQIPKVDREMALLDATLSKLRKKQEELEQSASKPAQEAEVEEAVPRHRSLAQCVYADNRKKATSAHALLAHLGPPVLYPLYNQPQDTEVYHENIRKHRTFRRRLAEHIRRLKLEAEKREDDLAEAYTQRAAEWNRRVDRIEQGPKRKAKDARNRDFFEKVFPELRKQREERERFNRLGARVKSEAELEEIADGLHEQEHEDKKMRALTVVPPLLRDPNDTAPVYTDTNRRCMDMESEHKELQLRNVWSQAEREVFRDKYLQHPKNFGQIASFLPRKSVRDCVRFYYLSKKAENYKQLLRKPRQRRSARNPAVRPQAEPELPAGVTTRLQRSQGTVGRVLCEPGVQGEGKEGEEDIPCVPVTCIPIPPNAPLDPSRVELIRTPPLPPSPPPGSSAPHALSTSISVDSPAPLTPPLLMEANMVTVTSADVTVTITAITTSASSLLPLPTSSIPSPSTLPTIYSSLASVPLPSPPPSSTAVVTPASNSAPPTPQPAQPPTPTQPPTPETAVTERTATPSNTATITTTSVTTISTCAVCLAPGATRPVSRSRVSLYSLKEEQVGALVCSMCHSRCVVSRYARCAVPRCSGPRVRERRLRYLPPRWHDLSMDHKRHIMDEFQIPSDLTKCCLTCFKRITRRLDALGCGHSAPTDEEVSRFRSLLREHGTHWEAMSSHTDKAPVTLKAFYYTYRKKLSLDAIVRETSTTEVRTSTEESLSSGDSDTASAGDSPRPAPAPAPDPRHEYDSSATETADEESETPTTNKVHKAPPPTTIPAPSSISSTTGLPPAPSPSPLPPSPAGALRNGPNAPQTVRDVVLNLIEISLTRDSQPPSIKPHQLKVSSSTSSRNDSLATLSVVSSVHTQGGARSPQRPATITPLRVSPPKETGGVLHISPRHERHERERQESLLDLSVKRRHDQVPLVNVNPTHANKMYRNSEYQSFRAQQERESPTQYNSKPKPVATPPRPPLKQPATKGSITLGTPVEARFEARRTPEPKAGSITAGTPVHATHHVPEKRTFDYFKRRSPGGAYYAQPSNQPRPQSPSFSPNASTPYSRSPYGMEQQRQIIITDFITSQQMHAGGRRQGAPSPPAQQYYGGQRREPPVSVIQRHYAPHPQHHPHPHPPPGHEAFTSLVDVASAATALPVPRGETKPEQKPQSHPQPHQSPHQPQQHQASHQGHQASHPGHQTSHTNKNHQGHQASHQGSHPSSHQTSHQSQQQHPQTHPQPHQQSHQQPHQQPHQQSHQQTHQQNHPHHHDIRIRDMNSHIQNPQKYHPQPIQYQVLERRAQQVQFLERDRQIQIQQQRRETERAMAAMQERAHAAAQMEQQLMHDRMHSVANEVDRRVAPGATYSVAKHRATPMHVDNRQKEVRPPAVSSAGAAPAAGAPRAEGTLTAASLIDAIITHQISQTSERFPRDCEPTPAAPERPTQQLQQLQQPPQQPHASLERDEHPPLGQHTTSFKLGDLASNIITRDFQSPTTSTLIHNNRFPAGTTEGYAATSSANTAPAANEDWKRRDNPKHAPFLEPVSPPDNHHNNRNATNRRYGCVGAGGFTTAYDYVTTRIVEVMRSDADERGADRSKALPQFPPTQYAFPFNALNVATPPDGAPPTSAPAPAAPAAPPPPEPAPLMSAQYEPLSDED